MQYISYLLFRLFIYLFAIIPFPVLYLLSDFLRIIFFYLIPYRKKVVIDNLTKCFPEYNKQQINELAWKFYRNLCDITLESIKGFTIPSKTHVKRYKVINPEHLTSYYNTNQSFIGVGGHYANWEWSTQVIGLQVKNRFYGFYKPLTNKYIDAHIKSERQKRGIELVSILDTRKVFQQETTKSWGYILISDQSPSNTKKAIWVNFMNRDTPCLHGPEFYAKTYNLPLVFFDVQRVKRGFYTVRTFDLIRNPKELPDGEVTAQTMRELEAQIRKKPEDWLWSHRRWKHTR